MTGFRNRRLAGVALAAGVAASVICAVSVGAVSPAAAAGSDGILVSADGVNFAPALNASLFDDLDRIVPGGSVAASVWVKNDSGAQAEMRVSARNVTHSSVEFADALQLAVWDSTAGNPAAVASRPIGSYSNCDVLVESRPIGAGEVTKLTLAFNFDDVDGSNAQDDTATVNVLVAMRDAAAGPYAGSACSDDGSLVASTFGEFDRLAAAGPSSVGPLLIGGGVLFALGAGGLSLVALRQKRMQTAARP